MKALENRTAVITGGSSGIGLAVARLFSENGAKVAITGRDQQKIEDALKNIGNGAIGEVCDIAYLGNIQKTYDNIYKELGKIDILVVNAAIAPSESLVQFSEDMFDDIMNVNVKGAFFSVQHSLPYLNDGASIILTGASAIYKGFSKYSVYAASKAAIRSFARSFSSELMHRNIRVNVLSPGGTDTPILSTGGITEDQLAQLKSFFAGTIPLKRLATPDEIAGSYLFLASDASKYMLGSEILIDGGLTEL